MRRTLVLLMGLTVGCSTCPQANIMDKVFKSKNACAPCAANAAVPPPVAIAAPPPATYVAPTCTAPGATCANPGAANVQGAVLTGPLVTGGAGNGQVLTNHSPTKPEASNDAVQEELPTPKLNNKNGFANQTIEESNLKPATETGPSLTKETPPKKSGTFGPKF